MSRLTRCPATGSRPEPRATAPKPPLLRVTAILPLSSVTPRASSTRGAHRSATMAPRGVVLSPRGSGGYSPSPTESAERTQSRTPLPPATPSITIPPAPPRPQRCATAGAVKRTVSWEGGGRPSAPGGRRRTPRRRGASPELASGRGDSQPGAGSVEGEGVRGQRLDDRGWQGTGLEAGPLDADQHLIPGGAQLRGVVAQHVEVQRERLRAHPPDVRRHPEAVVEAGRPIELAVNHGPREPHVVAIEDVAIGEPGGAEQLGLRDLEEAEVRRVADDPGEINVRPAHVLFDDMRVGGHARGT